MQNDQFLKFMTKNKNTDETVEIILNKDRILYIKQKDADKKTFTIYFSELNGEESSIDVLGISLERMRDSLN